MDDRRHVGVADVFGAEFSGDEQGCCRDVDVNVEVDGSGKLKGGRNGGEHWGWVLVEVEEGKVWHWIDVHALKMGFRVVDGRWWWLAAVIC